MPLTTTLLALASLCTSRTVLAAGQDEAEERRELSHGLGKLHTNEEAKVAWIAGACALVFLLAITIVAQVICECCRRKQTKINPNEKVQEHRNIELSERRPLNEDGAADNSLGRLVDPRLPASDVAPGAAGCAGDEEPSGRFDVSGQVLQTMEPN